MNNEYNQLETMFDEPEGTIIQNEEYLHSILQTIRVSLLVLDHNLDVLSVNSHFLKTFNVSAEETEGNLFFDLGNGQWNIPELKQLLEELLPSNTTIEGFEVEHGFAQIGKKVMMLNAHQLEFNGELKNRILIAIEDITERRELERRKDDFLSIASHELKTPLTVVKGYMQLINKLMPAKANQKFRDVIGKADLYMNKFYKLITRLLDVSRIKTGNIKLHKEPFDFDAMVYEVSEAVQTGTKSHKVRVEGHTGVSYNGDHLHIEQVITNLLDNAIKYSPGSEEVLVSISLGSNVIQVSITDTGIGITMEDQDKIFDRFFRVGAIQTHFPGLGIGLYLCSEIIKQHQGKLWVDSKKGHGSTFRFILPLVDAGAK